MLHSRIILSFVLLMGFAAADDYIMFPHQLHVEDMELSCEECHESVSEAKNMSGRLLPEKDSCLSCHDGDTATEDCESCHNDPDEPLPFEESQPVQNPEFSHFNHLSKNLECVQCHGDIPEGDGSLVAKTWGENDCRSCHQQNAPASHSIEWVLGHGDEVDGAENSCSTCHYQETCDACHLVQEVEPRVHPAGFILMHGMEANAGAMDCNSCHDLAADCRSCHDQNKIMPLSHGLGSWATVGNDGGMHAEMALDDVDNCLVCHEPAVDRSCSKCHDN